MTITIKDRFNNRQYTGNGFKDEQDAKDWYSMELDCEADNIEIVEARELNVDDIPF